AITSLGISEVTSCDSAKTTWSSADSTIFGSTTISTSGISSLASNANDASVREKAATVKIASDNALADLNILLIDPYLNAVSPVRVYKKTCVISLKTNQQLIPVPPGCMFNPVIADNPWDQPSP